MALNVYLVFLDLATAVATSNKLSTLLANSWHMDRKDRSGFEGGGGGVMFGIKTLQDKALNWSTELKGN